MRRSTEREAGRERGTRRCALRGTLDGFEIHLDPRWALSIAPNEKKNTEAGFCTMHLREKGAKNPLPSQPQARDHGAVGRPPPSPEAIETRHSCAFAWELGHVPPVLLFDVTSQETPPVTHLEMPDRRGGVVDGSSLHGFAGAVSVVRAEPSQAAPPPAVDVDVSGHERWRTDAPRSTPTDRRLARRRGKDSARRAEEWHHDALAGCFSSTERGRGGPIIYHCMTRDRTSQDTQLKIIDLKKYLQSSLPYLSDSFFSVSQQPRRQG